MTQTVERCPDEGALRAYVDGECTAAERARIDAHLRRCPACNEALAALAAGAEQVYMALDRLSVPAVSARAAWYRFAARQETASGKTLQWRLNSMWQSLRIKHGRMVAVSAMLVVLFVAAMFVEPVQTMAARFLGIFRVQQFQVVQVNATQAERYKNFDQQIFTDVKTGKVTPTDVTSAAQASQLAGFTVLTPSVLPNHQTLDKFVVEGAHNAQATVDLDAARNLLQMAGQPTDALPAGKTLNLSAKIQPTVSMAYGEGTPRVIHIIQGHSPEVNVPDNVDVKRLGEIGLEMMGVAPAEAARLSNSIDWATTMVIPVPSNLATVQPVTVHGVTGYLMRNQKTTVKENHGDDAVLFWEANGILYGVSGNLSDAELVNVAQGLK
jgi:anti-sigma factor RsiW